MQDCSDFCTMKPRPLPPLPQRPIPDIPGGLTITIETSDDVKGELKMFYLLAYNFIMGVGWLSVLYQLVYLSITGEGPAAMYTAFGVKPVQYLLLASWLEVLNGGLGLVRGGPLAPFLQTLGRSAVYFGTIATYEQPRETVWFPLLIAAWATSEVIRYPYYLGASINTFPPKLEWLRYTAFIVLYPIGFASELALFIITLPLYTFRIELPNPHNFEFNLFGCVLFGYLPVYAAGATFLYKYMLSQRRKKLSKRRD